MSSSENYATPDETRVPTRSGPSCLVSISQFFLDLILLIVALLLYHHATVPLRNVSTGAMETLLKIPLLPFFVAVLIPFNLGLVVVMIISMLLDEFAFGLVLAYPLFWLIRFSCRRRDAPAADERIGSTRRGRLFCLIRVILLSWIVVFISVYTIENRFCRDTDFTTFLRHDYQARRDKSQWMLPVRSGIVELGPFSSSPIENALQLDHFMRRQGFSRSVPDANERTSVKDSLAQIFRENNIDSPDSMTVMKYSGALMIPWGGSYLPTQGSSAAIAVFSADGKTYRCVVTYYPPIFP